MVIRKPRNRKSTRVWKQRIRDKYYDENYPERNIDYLEASLSGPALEILIHKYAPRSCYMSDEEQKKEDAKERHARDIRNKKLIRKILKTAASKGVLTDRQFQIFALRWLGLKETEIAEQIPCDQSYVSAVLKTTHEKLRVLLENSFLEIKSKQT